MHHSSHNCYANSGISAKFARFYSKYMLIESEKRFATNWSRIALFGVQAIQPVSTSAFLSADVCIYSGWKTIYRQSSTKKHLLRDRRVIRISFAVQKASLFDNASFNSAVGFNITISLGSCWSGYPAAGLGVELTADASHWVFWIWNSLYRKVNLKLWKRDRSFCRTFICTEKRPVLTWWNLPHRGETLVRSLLPVTKKRRLRSLLVNALLHTATGW